LDEFIQQKIANLETEVLTLLQFADLGSVSNCNHIWKKFFLGINIYIKNIRILPTEEFKYALKILDLGETLSDLLMETHENEIVRIENTRQ